MGVAKRTRRERLQYNPTVSAMRSGLMRHKRRVKVPMWHIEHLRQLIPLLRSAVEELERLERSNSLRNVDRCIYAQSVLISINSACSKMKPRDPRQRGGESLIYDPHLIDRNGHDNLQERDDLDEPQQKPDGRHGL